MTSKNINLNSAASTQGISDHDEVTVSQRVNELLQGVDPEQRRQLLQTLVN